MASVSTTTNPANRKPKHTELGAYHSVQTMPEASVIDPGMMGAPAVGKGSAVDDIVPRKVVGNNS